MNAWVGQTAGDYLAVSTELCVCAYVADLFGEGLLQQDYREDRAVLAYVATHPGAARREVAQVIRTPKRRAARNLDRLTDDSLLAVSMDGALRVLCSYQLALAGGEGTETSRS